MISEKNLEQEYIANNIDIFIEKIEKNNYDYNGEYHDELKSVLGYLVSINSSEILKTYCDHVKNIVLDEEIINKITLRSLAKTIIQLACNVSKEDREKLENRIIKVKNLYLIYQFALNIEGANIEKLEDAIVEAKNITSKRDKFGKGIPDEYLFNRLLEDGIIFMSQAECIYQFAILVKEANIEKLEDAIIATKSVSYIWLFAKYVKGANKEKLEDAAIRMGEARDIYAFMQNGTKEDIEKLEAGIISKKDIYYMKSFAIYVEEKYWPYEPNKIVDFIITTNNINYIRYFSEDHPMIGRDNEGKLWAAEWAFTEAEMRKRMIKETNDFYAKITKSENIGRYIFELDLSLKKKKGFINYLFNNIEEGNNSIILRIYSNMLKNPNFKEEDVDALDLEYKNYIMQNNKENNQGNVLKLKRFTDKSNNS